MTGYAQLNRNYPLVVLIILGLGLIGCGSSGGVDSIDVSSIRVKDLDGRTISLSDYKGRVIILNFFATWCPPCREEIPDFIELQKDFGGRGLTIVGISLDTEPPDEVRRFSRERGINFMVLYAGDQSQALADRVGGIRGIPTSLLIGRDGNVRRKVVGVAPKSQWAKDITPLL